MRELQGIYSDFLKISFSALATFFVWITHTQCLFFPILQEYCEGVIKAVCFSSTFCLFFLFIIRCDDTFACVASRRWHRNFVIKWEE